jgi:hypothetical protein
MAFVVPVMAFMSTAVLVAAVPITVTVAALLTALVVFPSPTRLFALAFVIRIVALVFRFVFLRAHEVHRPIAGVVLTAVLTPISRVTRRHMQVQGRRRSCHRFDQHRLGIDDGRRTIVAELHLAVHAWRDLARQHDADVQVARMSTADAGEHDRYKYE